MTYLLVFGFGLILVFQSSFTGVSNAKIHNLVHFPACDVFCHGDLLHKIQLGYLKNTSNYFVNLKLRQLPNITLENFDCFMTSNGFSPKPEALELFIKDNFEENVNEFKPWTPSDWKTKPKFLQSIKNVYFKFWANDLHGMWKKLGRRMIDDVHINPDLYSVIPVKNPIIVPNDSNNEFYYWDNYWIIRGLLHSGMYKTAEGMLCNFLSMIERFGFVPNGGRIYYAKRSQPPLLAGMIESYVEFTNNNQFAIDALGLLEKEFFYWRKNHMVVVDGYILAVYGDNSTGPRPESYREDFINASVFETASLKEAYYSEIRASAESGMPLSSRWVINDADGANNGSRQNFNCRSIVPVELNAILYWNAKIIAKFYSLTNNIEKAMEYTFHAKQILEAIDAVLWNDEVGVWLDYDLINKKSRNYFTPTNLSPLWTYAFNISDSPKISQSVLKYICDLKINGYRGGVPTTLTSSGEDWDFPNAWAPMQYIVVEGLENLNTIKSLRLSRMWGHRWVKSNYEAFRSLNNMFDKYNSQAFGKQGSGKIQTGFGWTNGVIIDFLVKYGQDIQPDIYN